MLFPFLLEREGQYSNCHLHWKVLCVKAGRVEHHYWITFEHVPLFLLDLWNLLCIYASLVLPTRNCEYGYSMMCFQLKQTMVVGRYSISIAVHGTMLLTSTVKAEASKANLYGWQTDLSRVCHPVRSESVLCPRHHNGSDLVCFCRA